MRKTAELVSTNSVSDVSYDCKSAHNLQFISYMITD